MTSSSQGTLCRAAQYLQARVLLRDTSANSSELASSVSLKAMRTFTSWSQCPRCDAEGPRVWQAVSPFTMFSFGKYLNSAITLPLGPLVSSMLCLLNWCPYISIPNIPNPAWFLLFLLFDSTESRRGGNTVYIFISFSPKLCQSIESKKCPWVSNQWEKWHCHQSLQFSVTNELSLNMVHLRS